MRLMQLRPDFSESFYNRLFVDIDPSVKKPYCEGLNRAGLSRFRSADDDRTLVQSRATDT